MELVRWNPRRELFGLHNSINRMFNDFFSPTVSSDEAVSIWGWNPVVDIYENEENIVIKAELPGVDKNDIDVWEVNEDFASQAIAVCRDLDLDMEKVNPNGSGISLGHPIGATGALITVKAIHELQRISGKYAVVTMCIGGGQGIAALIESI